MKLYYNPKKDTYLNGFLLGFAIATIIWCTLWPYAMTKIEQQKQHQTTIIQK